MISSSIIIRLFVICVSFWLLIINAHISYIEEGVPEKLIALYGIVMNVSESGDKTILTLINGDDEWKILFDNPDSLPDIGRAVIVLARDTSDAMLLGISYDYP